MPFYDYTCGRHVTTARRGYDIDSIPCGTCERTASRTPFNTPFIHGSSGPAGTLTPDELSPERFLDRAEYIDDAYARADSETGQKLKRPKGYKAGIVRARAMQIEREGFNHKTVEKLNELDRRAIA